MAVSVINGDVSIQGSLTSRSFNPPAGCIDNDAIEAGAGIESSKLEHRHVIRYDQITGTAVTAETRGVHIVRGATGTLISMEAAIVGAIATGGDRTVTVDLRKSTGGAAFATVCSSTIGFTSADTIRVPEAAVFSSTSLVDGDILQIVVTVAGAAGNQAQGLVVTLNLDEDAS